MQIVKLNKDHYGAALLILMGAGVVMEASRYSFGSLTQMGPGFIPIVLGVLLMLVGLIIGLTARSQDQSSRIGLPRAHRPARAEWRGWLCIVGAVVAFVLLGRHDGLAPATFASVFIAACGDRENSMKDAALLALGVTIVGTLIFSWALHLQLPLFAWGA